MKDYYKILNVTKEAKNEDIIKSFRRLAKKYHPDINKSTNAAELFCDIYEAYEILRDANKRRTYDILYASQQQSKHQESHYKQQYQYQENQQHKSHNQYHQQYENNYNKYNKNDTTFNEWSTKAKNNAAYYSKMNYTNFIKSIFDNATFVAEATVYGIYLLFKHLILTFIKTIVTIVLIFVSLEIILIFPIDSFFVNIYFGLLNTIIAIIYIRNYILIYKNYESIWEYIKTNRINIKNKFIQCLILFIIAFTITFIAKELQ